MLIGSLLCVRDLGSLARTARRFSLCSVLGSSADAGVLSLVEESARLQARRRHQYRSPSLPDSPPTTWLRLLWELDQPLFTSASTGACVSPHGRSVTSGIYSAHEFLTAVCDSRPMHGGRHYVEFIARIQPGVP